MSSSWLGSAVSEFGERCKAKLAGPGEAEAAIRAPIEQLLAAVGAQLELDVVPHDEVRDNDRGVRPDYAISVGGAITGYLEVKKPGANLDPDSMRGHDLKQWTRQKDLPNLIYTNGTEWRLYRDSELVGDPIHLAGGSLRVAGSKLVAPSEFEQRITDFLRWEPAPITSVIALVRAIAPLTRLLRGEVIDQLAMEKRSIRAGGRAEDQPFHGLARDWRQLLFPTASDATFADGYAQTVTFALLLARTEDISLAGAGGLHAVGTKLAGQHSLMARALQLLTDYVADDFRVTIDLLVRVTEAVQWPKIRGGRRDTYLHLYETFLDVYDPLLRQQSGSYYTPREVVEQMVRLTEEVLETRLGRSAGFADPNVVVADPAMGTGTFLHTVIEHVAERVAERDGRGAVSGAVSQLAERLVGFELQTGPFAVAELRATDLLTDLGASLPPRGLGLYVTDTLDDPHAEQTQLGSGLELISRSRSRAAQIKAKTKVTVVIGNPPYDERAQGRGGWIENGSDSEKTARGSGYCPLDDFRAEGNGRTEYVLKNLYIYFWRWATWKVFDANANVPDGDVGVVCYITTSGYLRGAGFKGMREYLRRTTSEGWIIDVSPEGMRPDVATRIFPGVQQPLAIAIFTRRPDCDSDVPAIIHYTAIHGRRIEKYAALAALNLDGNKWRQARTAWQAPFTPAADTDWDDFPALNDLFPWTAPGVKPNRTWVYAPARDILIKRLERLIAESDLTYKKELFKETSSSSLETVTKPLAGPDTEQATTKPLSEASLTHAQAAKLVRVGYRSFDRQWLIADRRLMHRPSPDLWSARRPGQLFVVEQHSKPISDGPGVVFSALIPDMDHFKGSEGGRTVPLLHPGGRPNVAAGLLGALSTLAGRPVTAEDVVAYVAGVVAHSGFTDRFADELTTPGIRIPVTTRSDLFQQAMSFGREVVWLHTYGAVFVDQSSRRPADDVRLPADDARRVTNLSAIAEMPTEMTYDRETRELRLGRGSFGPVTPEVWEYTVGGKNVLRSWFGYRKAEPGGKKTSPLDKLHVTSWLPEWTGELLDLLSVLTRLIALEDAQSKLLDEIMAGSLASRDMLARAGTVWPAADRDPQRKPDYANARPEVDESDEGQLGFAFS
ncbi:type ISP restriction/modification enzyme [Gordonia sp. AC31]|uniref:type ISP restriction/modification enzyme n=1 Tax=Gordonia sp. AC31 TaxID=2962571 RepID=UPI0022B4BD2C|nr:type ISP restriction/modification enzyme [Gordonia sp. AC31]MCZ4538375.1 N-6 DNA methylase [Gordonia terrae]MDT0223578.1 type ISP restriction/modification enzyme [Gordonia sp. AC31]